MLGIETTPEKHSRSDAGDTKRARARNRAAAWLVAGISAVTAAVAGGYRLGQPPLWRDEAATKAIAGRSVSQILATLPHDDVVHGAYYLVVHVVEKFLGSSTAALRLPSVVAIAVASAFTALIARHLAEKTDAPFASLTGLAAGALFAMTPSTISYAQEARSYATVTMLAVIATYLLIRAIETGGRWWPAYGAAVALTGLFNLFGLLILVPHGLTMLTADRRGKALVRWLVAAGVAGAVLIPVAIEAYAQRGALGWMAQRPPWWPNFRVFIDSGAGSTKLTLLVLAVAAAGIIAEVAAARGRPGLGPATVALPWLLAPPVLLLTWSQVHNSWDIRYVEFCLPAFAILVAWGVNRLARLVVRPPRLAWIPLAIAPLAVVAVMAHTESAVRYSRPDNLQAESSIIARHALPGDIVFYLPVNDRIVSMPFPGPFAKLRDIAMAESPVASNTLYGTDVSPAVLLKRFVRVTRVWVVTSSEVNYFTTARVTPLDAEEGRLIQNMRIIGHWRDGDTMLTLYAKR